MNGLSRLAGLMMAAAISSIAAAGKQTLGDIGGGPNPIKAPKTKEPSASKGGRGYGRHKFGNTAAFLRAATKTRNVKRYRAACR